MRNRALAAGAEARRNSIREWDVKSEVKMGGEDESGRMQTGVAKDRMAQRPRTRCTTSAGRLAVAPSCS